MIALHNDHDRDAFMSGFQPRDWVIVEPEELRSVAAVMRVERKRHEIFVHELVVETRQQGRGLASMLIRELIDEAIRSDTAVALHVAPLATRALRLLRYLGFVVVPSPVAGRCRFLWKA